MFSSLRQGCSKRLASAAAVAAQTSKSSTGVTGIRSVTSKSPTAAQNFVDKVVNICPNDEQWKCYRKPEIDPNTSVYETFYGQSCMLAPVSYNILHSKQEDYTESDEVRDQYTECVTSIMNERLDDAINSPSSQLGYGLKRIIVGGMS